VAAAFALEIFRNGSSVLDCCRDRETPKDFRLTSVADLLAAGRWYGSVGANVATR